MKNKQQGFISIIAVLGVGLFAMATALTMTGGVIQQLVQSRNNISTNQAFYTAEATVLEGIYQTINYEESMGEIENIDIVAPDLNQTETNSFSILLSDFGSGTVSGDAEKGDTYRKVLYDLLVFPEGDAFSYALYTPHVVEVSGNATINGNVFAADGVNPDGDPMGSAEINGDIEDEQEPFKPLINDLEYRDAANGVDGEFFTSISDAEQYFLDNPIINNKFIFVEAEGQMDIQNTDFTGSLWVTGDLKITGGTFNSIEPWVVIVVEGNLEIVGNPIINGIVYVRGNTTIGAGTVHIYGSLICVGDESVIDVNGNITVDYDPHIVDFWDDIVGLEDTYDPVILGWNEE